MIETERSSPRARHTGSRVQDHQRAFVAMRAEDGRSVCHAVRAKSQHLLVVRQRAMQVDNLEVHDPYMGRLR